MRRPALCLAVFVVGATSLWAADPAEVIAARQSQLKELHRRRADFTTKAQVLQATIRANQEQFTALERQYNTLARELASIKDVKEKIESEDGKEKTDRGAEKQNEANDREREKLRSQMSRFSGEGKTLRTKIDQDTASLQLSSYLLEAEWSAMADRFGRLSRAEHAASVALFDQWIAADKKDAGAYFARGLARLHMQQLEEAGDDFREAIDLVNVTRTASQKSYVNPLLISVYCARAVLRLSEGKKSESARDFASASKFENAKNHIDCCLYQGIANCRQDKLSFAEGKFKQAVKLYPKEAEGHRLLALLYAAGSSEKLRDGRKAVESAQQACELTNHQDWSCLYALAAAQAEAGMFEEAASLAAQAADLAIDEHRQECLRCQAEYQARRPLRLDWK